MHMHNPLYTNKYSSAIHGKVSHSIGSDYLCNFVRMNGHFNWKISLRFHYADYFIVVMSEKRKFCQY